MPAIFWPSGYQISGSTLFAAFTGQGVTMDRYCFSLCPDSLNMYIINKNPVIHWLSGYQISGSTLFAAVTKQGFIMVRYYSLSVQNR